MFLKIENIECRMASTNVLRSCSLDVEGSQIVCLLGRNGAGKSSILKNIIGLYPTLSGRILFKGQDITKRSTRDRVMEGIAYSPEDSRLFPDLTVEENIRIGFWVTGHTDRAGGFSMEKVFQVFPAIKKLVERRAGTLSGGEKKMVSVSRALALSPFLVLLDESFEGLSPLVVKAFSDAMATIKADLGASILLAESNVHNASQVAERCYIIDRGEIIFEGQPEEILQNEQLLKMVGK
jgi:branched-chain amino acid transport system ATP-binding protein